MDQFEVPAGARNDDLSRLETGDLIHELMLYYSDVGWWVESIEAGSALRGRADFGLRKESQYLLVQCAHWRAPRISASTVEALIAAVNEARAGGAILISAGEFTSEAVAAARHGHVELIDYDHLYAMFGPLRGLRAVDDPEHDMALFADGDDDAAAEGLLRGARWRWLVAMACVLALLFALSTLRDREADGSIPRESAKSSD